MTINRILLSASAAALGLSMATSAMAIPALQLFIEGADYQTADENSNDKETWAKLGTTSFRLWVIGGGNNVIDATHRISNVTLVASFPTSYLDSSPAMVPTLVFTPANATQPGFVDNSVSDADPDAPGIQGPTGPSGPFAPNIFIPPLTNHSPYGQSDRTVLTWNLGMFSLTDSKLADFAPFPDGTAADPYGTGPYDDSDAVEASDNWLPTPTDKWGQINVYDLLVSGLEVGEQVHFDVFGVQQAFEVHEISGATCTSWNGQSWNGNANTCNSGYVAAVYDDGDWYDVYNNSGDLKYQNAPFSHDARWEQIATDIPQVPEPASMTLLGAGLMGLGYFGRRRKAA